MQRCLPLLCTGALFSALAHAQCLLPATGTTVLPIYQWSSSTGFAAGPVVSTDDAMTITPIAMTAMANFPMVGALGTLDQIWINSNGELYLTDSTLGLTNVVDGASLGVTTLAEMRGDIANASARIAIFGSDQDVSVVAGSAPDILVDQTVPGQIRITYVDWSYFSSSVDQYTMSCTLYSSGAVQFDYDTPMSATSTTRYVGISIGNNVGTTTTPSSDLSAGADSGTLGLLFESFANLAAFDLAGKSLLLTPNGTGGYISAVTCEPAAHTSYGTGCYSFPSTFAQLFPDQATTKAALDGNRMRLTPATGGYTATWVAGGASSYIAPTGGATTLTYPIANAAVVVTPSVPFPVPGGTAPVLSVSENGIVTASASANNASDTTPTLSDLSSSAAPALAFYSFRDFTLTEVGSGPIQREEVVVGPDTILCLTWNGVEAAPAAPTVNPTTFQFQLNLTTGVVDYVWVSWDPGTSTSDTLVGCTLVGANATPTSITLSTALPLGIVPETDSSLYQLFADAATAKAALDGNGIEFAPSGTGYTATWLPGPGVSYIAPTGAATTHTFGAANGSVQITPSIAMPIPGGTAPTISVSENGILTAAATPNNGTDTSPLGSDMTGTAAPALGFYSWRNFDLAEVGSGFIKSEEVVVGPNTFLVVTWEGVEAPPAAPTVNPSTFQFQVNLTTGVVRIVWVTWDPSTSTDDTLVGISLAGTGTTPFAITLATALPQTIAAPLTNGGRLSISASPSPVITLGGAGPSVPMTWTIENVPDFAPPFGLRVCLLIFSAGSIPSGVDLGSFPADIGAPGCNAYIPTLDVVFDVSLLTPGSPSTIMFPLTFPQPLSPGVTFYSQAVALFPPNSLPGGLNNFGMLTSNAIESKFQLF